MAEVRECELEAIAAFDKFAVAGGLVKRATEIRDVAIGTAAVAQKGEGQLPTDLYGGAIIATLETERDRYRAAMIAKMAVWLQYDAKGMAVWMGQHWQEGATSVFVEIFGELAKIGEQAEVGRRMTRR
jgi:hypothetical protein